MAELQVNNDSDINIGINHTSGILTNLSRNTHKKKGCAWMIFIFLAWSLIITLILSIVFALNASKLFANLGRYALPATMQALDSNIPPDERNDFSNAYLYLFNQIDQDGFMSMKPWVVTAITNLAVSARDHKINSSERAEFCSSVWYNVQIDREARSSE